MNSESHRIGNGRLFPEFYSLLARSGAGTGFSGGARGSAKLVRADDVDSLGRKPNCLLERRLFEFRKS